MIKAGYCFCHRCAGLFEIADAYYKCGEQPVGARLRRSAFSLGEKHWEIEPFRPDNGEIRLQDSPKLLRISKERDGIPDSIDCTFGEDVQTEYRLYRSCPRCKTEHTVLNIDSGRYPTYVVAMVGATQVGKSAWLHAIATDINLNAVNAVRAYPYELDFVEKHATNQWDMGATVASSAGASNYLRIRERGNRKIVANVIFIDAAGELFKDLNTYQGTQREYLLGNGKFPGVDAVIYMDSAQRASSKIQDSEDRERYMAAFQVYSEMERTGALEDKPVAFVYTHTDLLVANKRDIPKVKDLSGTIEVPVCSKMTFENKTSYEPQKLWPRLVQEDLIARTINDTVLQNTATNRKGFMIQTCSRKVDEDGKPRNDYRENFNVMDPVLWLLNTLNLFPIPLK